MSIRPLRAVLLTLTIAAIAAAGYTAYWFSAAAELRAGIATWTEQRRKAGWSVELGEPDIGGFPNRIEVLVQTPRLEGPAGRWRWTAPNIRAVAQPWSLGEISVFFPGIHVYATRKGDLWAEFDQAEAEILVGSSAISDIVVRLATINVRLPDGAPLLAKKLVARVRDSVVIDPAADIPETGTSVAVDVRDILFPARWQPPLGRVMARLSVDAVVTGEATPDVTIADTLTRWRDGGGAAEIKAFAVDWGALALRADGTFALDRKLQPQGAMMADIRGIDRTTDQLIAAGVIDARTAFAAKVANRALSFRGGSAKLPLSVQEQRLYLGPVPILRLKAVRWD
jgi:hypothetical protein